MARSEAMERFRSSMTIGHDQWRDGIGYDLEALAALAGPERDDAERLLLARAGEDWRDLEALAALATPKALAALRRSLAEGAPQIRLAAAGCLHELGELDDLGPAVLEALGPAKDDFSLFSRVLDEIGEHKVRAAIPALLEMARAGDGTRAVNAAAMVYYLAGLASEPFDWDHRPFFLRFAEAGDDRRAAFEELCAALKNRAG